MNAQQKTACEIIYDLGANGIRYGEQDGVCRITGKRSKGVPFDSWIRKTFTDIASLKPGTIISNEAIFCFEEASDLIRVKTGKEKPQRFRTYSHIVHDGVWYCFTKANKPEIYQHIIEGADLVCLADSGQKHILFKHRDGMWQMEDSHIMPDIDLLKSLHETSVKLMELGFSQGEIISGQYIPYRISKVSLTEWRELEKKIQPHRGSALFELSCWMLFKEDSLIQNKQKDEE